MEFRLTNRADLTPEMCGQVLSFAQSYCAENNADAITPYEVLNIFLNFAGGNSKDPQFWICTEGVEIIGYMITMPQFKNKKANLNIRIGYIDSASRGNGVAGHCLEIIEDKAKKAGYELVTLETPLNPEIYGRWIRRYGYGYMSTEYKKEL